MERIFPGQELISGDPLWIYAGRTELGGLSWSTSLSEHGFKKPMISDWQKQRGLTEKEAMNKVYPLFELSGPQFRAYDQVLKRLRKEKQSSTFGNLALKFQEHEAFQSSTRFTLSHILSLVGFTPHHGKSSMDNLTAAESHMLDEVADWFAQVQASANAGSAWDRYFLDNLSKMSWRPLVATTGVEVPWLKAYLDEMSALAKSAQGGPFSREEAADKFIKKLTKNLFKEEEREIYLALIKAFEGKALAEKDD